MTCYRMFSAQGRVGAHSHPFPRNSASHSQRMVRVWVGLFTWGPMRYITGFDTLPEMWNFPPSRQDTSTCGL